MTVRPVRILAPNNSVDRAPDLRLRGSGFESRSGPSSFLPFTLHAYTQQNKAFGQWNVDNSNDDVTEGLVREVWSTVSEVLSEDDHIPQEAETQPSQNREAEFNSITEDKQYK